MNFWEEHGTRIIFGTIATLFATLFYFVIPDMQAEGKVIYVGIAMLCFNKARGNGKPAENKDTT